MTQYLTEAVASGCSYEPERKVLSDPNWTRYSLVRKYSFALPDEGALDLIAEYSPIVEIGAGTGYWAHCLREQGVDVVAYDYQDPGVVDYGFRQKWTQVIERDGLEVIGDYGNRTLFLCWPCLDDSWSEEVLKRYFAVGGQTVIYIGESLGGCTANDGFHEFLQHEFILVRDYQIPYWQGMHDSLGVWHAESKDL